MKPHWLGPYAVEESLRKGIKCCYWACVEEAVNQYRTPDDTDLPASTLLATGLIITVIPFQQQCEQNCGLFSIAAALQIAEGDDLCWN